MGDGIGHVAYAGVAAGLLLEVWPTWSALIVAVAAAVGMEWLRTRGRTPSDLVLALVFYGGLAAGVVMINKADAASTASQYLFGQILSVDGEDVAVVVAVGTAIVVTMAVLGRALVRDRARRGVGPGGRDPGGRVQHGARCAHRSHGGRRDAGGRGVARGGADGVARGVGPALRPVVPRDAPRFVGAGRRHRDRGSRRGEGLGPGPRRHDRRRRRDRVPRHGIRRPAIRSADRRAPTGRGSRRRHRPDGTRSECGSPCSARRRYCPRTR